MEFYAKQDLAGTYSAGVSHGWVKKYPVKLDRLLEGRRQDAITT